MDKVEALEGFLANSSPTVSWQEFLGSLLLAATLAHLVGLLYVHCGTTLTNRKSFSRNFSLLTVTTLLVIAIVKSSLALSLGLVGALSIVRFRAAIKEPEELAYLFLCIAIGLGLGADQKAITLITFIVVGLLIGARKMYRGKNDHENLYLTVAHNKNGESSLLDEVIESLRTHCEFVRLKRLDERENRIEATFLIHFRNFDHFEKSRKALNLLSSDIELNYIHNSGL